MLDKLGVYLEAVEVVFDERKPRMEYLPITDKLMNVKLKDMPTWKISRYSVNGTGDMDDTYSMGSQKLYVMLPDYDTVDQATNYIKGIIDGKSLSELGL